MDTLTYKQIIETFFATEPHLRANLEWHMTEAHFKQAVELMESDSRLLPKVLRKRSDVTLENTRIFERGIVIVEDRGQGISLRIPD